MYMYMCKVTISVILMFVVYSASEPLFGILCCAQHLCMWVCVAVHCRKFMARSSTNQCSIIMCVTMIACLVTVVVTVPKQGTKFQNPEAEPLN